MGVELGCWWPSSTHPFPICPASFNALCRVRFPVGFRFGKRPKRETTLLISEWRMPFLTCCSHVFPLTFANGPVFGKLIPRQQLLIYRDPRRSTLYTRKNSSERLGGGSHKMLFVHHSTLLGRERGNDARKRSCKEFRGIETAVDSLKAFAMKDGGRWGRFFPFSIGDEKLLNVDWYGLLVTHTPSRRRCCLSSTWYSTIAMGSGIGGKEQKRLRDAHTKSKALGEKENGNEKEILSLSCTLCIFILSFLKKDDGNTERRSNGCRPIRTPQSPAPLYW